MTYRILIVEDELMIAEMIKEMLMDLGYSVIGVAKNYQRAMAYLEEHKDIDLVMLDINLEEEKDGIDIGWELKKNYKIPFIYLTSYTDKMTVKRAAETSPEAYLAKPFSSADLFATIEIIRARDNRQNFMSIKDGHGMVNVDTREIFYLQSDNVYVEVFTERKKYVVRDSLANILSELDHINFIRVHRSFAVNLLHFKALHGQHIYVGQYKCPISRSYREELKELITGNR